MENLRSVVVYTLKTAAARGTSRSNGLGVEGVNGIVRGFFSLGATCLLMVIQILNVWEWLDYLRWKFKIFSHVLWNLESVSWSYVIQLVELVDQEWRLTKLRKNIKCQLHVVPAQHCNQAFSKGNVHALTGVHINVSIVSLLQILGVEVMVKSVDSQGLTDMSGGLTSVRSYFSSWPYFSYGTPKEFNQATFAILLKLFSGDTFVALHISVGVVRIQSAIFEQLTCFRCCSHFLVFLLRHNWRFKGVLCFKRKVEMTNTSIQTVGVVLDDYFELQRYTRAHSSHKRTSTTKSTTNSRDGQPKVGGRTCLRLQPYMQFPLQPRQSHQLALMRVSCGIGSIATSDGYWAKHLLYFKMQS